MTVADTYFYIVVDTQRGRHTLKKHKHTPFDYTLSRIQTYKFDV